MGNQSGWIVGRKISWGSKVQEAVEMYSRELPRFDDSFLALQLRLARNYQELKDKTILVHGVNHHIYVQSPDPVAKNPQITVLFTQDNHQVNILSLHASEVEFPEDY